MTRALLVQPNDSHATLITFDGTNDAETMKTMQKLVGGWLEGLPMPVVGAQALLNEEAKLEGLAVNELATQIALATHSLHPSDTIHGPMVIVSVGREGATGDVPERVLAALRRAGVEIREEE